MVERRRGVMESREDPSSVFVELVEECRSHCLWFAPPDVMPTDRESQLVVLRMVERYGTRDEYVRAKRLRAWLLQHSNETFSVS
jgi:hypothetical protein